MNLALEAYKNNMKFLKTTMRLTHETLGEFYETLSQLCHLWSNSLKLGNLAQTGLERKYEGEEYEEEKVEGIQKKGDLFLSKLYVLCEGDQSKQLDVYEVGKGLGYDASETKFIVRHLSRAELIRHEKSSDKVTITSYGIMVIKGEITVGHAPVH